MPVVTHPSPHPAKAICASRRITNRRLAVAVGCNESTLGRILNGYIVPWPALRRRVAEFLGVPEHLCWHQLGDES